MVNVPSTLRNDPETADGVDLRSMVLETRRLVAPPVQFVAFWAAISLPFLYLPLFSGGLEATEVTVFLGLLGLHVVALFVGHGHRNDR
jgi:hypothetical protein